MSQDTVPPAHATARDPLPAWPPPADPDERRAWQADQQARYSTGITFTDPPEGTVPGQGTVPIGRTADPEAIARHNARVMRQLHESSWRVRQQRERDAWERELFYAKLETEMRREERLAAKVAAILAGELIPVPRPRTWEGHLMWLRLTFGDREFTTLHVRDAALAGRFIAPPDYEARDGHWRQGTVRNAFDADDDRFTLRLGQAYAALGGDLVEGWLWLAAGGVTHNRRRWQVSAKVPFPPAG